MRDSKLPLNKWALGFFLFSTNLKGLSSMKLHRDLNVTQKYAWHMAHWIRETWINEVERFSGPVEVDETHVGGKEGNRHASKRLRAECGAVGKVPVVGVKDRASGKVKLAVVDSSNKETLQEFVTDSTNPEAVVYTDTARAYEGLDRPHEKVNHSQGEYVRGEVTTNSVESNRVLFKRGVVGVYHHVSPKHLHRYVTEFEGRHNAQEEDTVDQVAGIVTGSVGKRLPYQELIAGRVYRPLTGGEQETITQEREVA